MAAGKEWVPSLGYGPTQGAIRKSGKEYGCEKCKGVGKDQKSEQNGKALTQATITRQKYAATSGGKESDKTCKGEAKSKFRKSNKTQMASTVEMTLGTETLYRELGGGSRRRVGEKVARCGRRI